MPQLVDNRYRIVRPLGTGGMAEVYLAHDDVLDRDVALKIMSAGYAQDEEFVERFRREAQSAAALTHPNIVSIYDRGETGDDPGTYYIAMEYLPGGTLKDRISSRGALPARTAAEVALQIAEALKAAHERDVVHRDIKPHNILVTESGDLKVTDFGIARAATSSTMTRTGSIMGTAHYISPEQAMGEAAGPQSDLYSLGVVLYEMITGELPFDAETPIGIAMKHVNASPAPPGELDPSIPEGLAAITLRLMSKDPDDRYPDESELIRDLESVVQGSSPSRATTEILAGAAPSAAPSGGDGSEDTIVSHRGEAAKRGKRRRRALPLILLGVLALLALVGWGTYSMLSQPPTLQVPEIAGLSLQEAREQHGEDFTVAVSERRDSPEPEGTILEQDPAAGSEAEQGSEISVAVSGQQVVEVPDVVGEPRQEAESTLSDDGFGVDVQTEESSAEEEGEVISQSPAAGEEADFESEVTITVGEGPAPVPAPDLSGLTVSEAESALADAGLELGARNEAASAAVAESGIISQSPAAGSEVEPGGTVDVTVSTGPEPVSVPNLYGYGAAEAEAILADAGLELGQVTEEETGELSEGLIFSQSLASGASAEPGTAVDVTVSAGPEPVTVPNVIGEDLASAQQAMLDAGLGYTTRGVQSSEPEGTVLYTSPASGAELEPGTQVAISYSLGPPDPAPAPAPSPDLAPSPSPDSGSGSSGGGGSGGNSGGGPNGGSGGGSSGPSGPGGSGSGGGNAGVGGSGNGTPGGGNLGSSGAGGGDPGRTSGGSNGGNGGFFGGLEEPEEPDIEDPEAPDIEEPEAPEISDL